MNALETTVFSAAVRAARTYSAMTDGGWLSDGPEVFLQTEVARAIWRARKSRKILVDLPNQKIDEWSASETNLLSRDQRNRPRQRPDIYIANASWEPIAAIEVKTKGTFVGVLKDAEKIKKSFKNTNPIKVGYLLVYFEGWKYRKKGARIENRRAAKKHVEGKFVNQIKKLRKGERHIVRDFHSSTSAAPPNQAATFESQMIHTIQQLSGQTLRTAFSASSRLFDLNGETKMAITKHSSAIIALTIGDFFG